jgi:hypothetical protein
LERLWKEEVAKKGTEKASFFMTVLRFARTREILTFIALVISCALSFSTPVSVYYDVMNL